MFDHLFQEEIKRNRDNSFFLRVKTAEAKQAMSRVKYPNIEIPLIYFVELPAVGKVVTFEGRIKIEQNENT